MTGFSFYIPPGPSLVPEAAAPASAGSTLSPEADAATPAPAGSTLSPRGRCPYPCRVQKFTITNSRNILRILERGRSQGQTTSSSELSFLQKLLQDSLILQGRHIFW